MNKWHLFLGNVVLKLSTILIMVIGLPFLFCVAVLFGIFVIFFSWGFYNEKNNELELKTIFSLFK